MLAFKAPIGEGGAGWHLHERSWFYAAHAAVALHLLTLYSQRSGSWCNFGGRLGRVGVVKDQKT